MKERRFSAFEVAGPIDGVAIGEDRLERSSGM